MFAISKNLLNSSKILTPSENDFAILTFYQPSFTSWKQSTGNGPLLGPRLCRPSSNSQKTSLSIEESKSDILFFGYFSEYMRLQASWAPTNRHRIQNCIFCVFAVCSYLWKLQGWKHNLKSCRRVAKNAILKLIPQLPRSYLEANDKKCIWIC